MHGHWEGWILITFIFAIVGVVKEVLAYHRGKQYKELQDKPDKTDEDYAKMYLLKEKAK